MLYTVVFITAKIWQLLPESLGFLPALQISQLSATPQAFTWDNSLHLFTHYIHTLVCVRFVFFLFFFSYLYRTEISTKRRERPASFITKWIQKADSHRRVLKYSNETKEIINLGLGVKANATKNNSKV